MRVFTSRPIIEEKSNCCGGSNFNGSERKSNCCGGCSNADGEEDIKLNLKTLKTLATTAMSDTELATPTAPANVAPQTSQSNREMFGDYLSSEKSARKENRGKKVSDVLEGSSNRKSTRRSGQETSRALRLENKDKRVSERLKNREARAKRRSDRKAKRNAKKLLLLQTTRNSEPKFFFPLQKLRLSKKKKGTYEKTYPDGSISEIPIQGVITDNETGAVYDKVEISNATNVPLPKVTPQVLKTTESTNVTDPISKEQTKAIVVPDENVSGASDGNAYLASDVQGSNEPPKDVKADDEKKEGEQKGWSTTTKVIVSVSALAVVGLIIYAVVKGKSTVTPSTKI